MAINNSDVIEHILQKEKTLMAPKSIIDKAIRLHFFDPSTKLLNSVRSTLNRSTSKFSKTQRPQFLKFGKYYGLGSWFKDWPPNIEQLSYYILKANNYSPIHYTEITKRIEKFRDIKNVEPENMVEFLLLRGKRFVSFENGYYGLRGWKTHLSKPIEFCYSTPQKDWVVSQRFSEVFSTANNMVRIVTPYIDKSTFETFLGHIPTLVDIQILYQSKDKQLPSKIEKGLTSSFLSGWLNGRTVYTKEIDGLHSRFIIVDDLIAGISSADLQRSQQQQKYQYISICRDKKLVKKCIKYFEEIWGIATEDKLIERIKSIEGNKQ